MKGNYRNNDNDNAKGLWKWSLHQCFLEEWWLCEIAFVKVKTKGLQLLIYDESLDKHFICEDKIGQSQIPCKEIFASPQQNMKI